MDYVFPLRRRRWLCRRWQAATPASRCAASIAGRNYAEHAKEMGFTGRESVLLLQACRRHPVGGRWLSGRNAVPAQNGQPALRNGAGRRLGQGERDLTVEQADECVWGYALVPGHDAPRPAGRGQEAGPSLGKWARLSISRRRSAPSIRAAPSARWTKAPSGWTSMASATIQRHFADDLEHPGKRRLSVGPVRGCNRATSFHRHAGRRGARYGQGDVIVEVASRAWTEAARTHRLNRA